MKLMFLNSMIGYHDLQNTKVLSLSISHPFVESLSSLVTVPQELWNDTQAYSNYIFSYSSPFLDFMKIVYPIYEGQDVVIITPSYLDNLVETIIRVLYQRYDIISSYINEPSDYELVNDTDFSMRGLCILDKDKECMRQILEKETPTTPIPSYEYVYQSLFKMSK